MCIALTIMHMSWQRTQAQWRRAAETALLVDQLLIAQTMREVFIFAKTWHIVSSGGHGICVNQDVGVVHPAPNEHCRN